MNVIVIERYRHIPVLHWNVRNVRNVGWYSQTINFVLKYKTLTSKSHYRPEGYNTVSICLIAGCSPGLRALS